MHLCHLPLVSSRNQHRFYCSQLSLLLLPNFELIQNCDITAGCLDKDTSDIGWNEDGALADIGFLQNNVDR